MKDEFDEMRKWDQTITKVYDEIFYGEGFVQVGDIRINGELLGLPHGMTIPGDLETAITRLFEDDEGLYDMARMQLLGE